MKIVFTTHTYYPHKDGVAIVNEYMTKGLSEKGYVVVVVTHTEDGQKEYEERNGISIYRVYNGDAEKYIGFIKKMVSFDDVLVNVCTQTPTTDILYRQLEDIDCQKKILYVHGIWHFGWEKRNFESLHNIVSKVYNNMIWRWYYTSNGKYIKKYDAVIQLHEHDEGNEYFRKKYGINSFIIENAADDAFFERADDSDIIQKYNLPDRYMICVANYSKAKNQEMVLRAYYQSGCSYEMIFVGQDKSGYIDYLKKVEQEYHSKTVKKVRFLQNIPREEIPALVRNAYLFLFGSVGEKFPVSIVEAMAAGIPFVSTDVGVVSNFPGGKSVCNNKKGIKEMADCIDYYIQNIDSWNSDGKMGQEFAFQYMKISKKTKEMEKIISNVPTDVL